MRLILLLTVFLLLAITPVVAQEVFYFPQVGDGVFAEAEIRFQTTVIFVNTGEDTVLTLEFFGGDGQPLPFDLPPLGINSFFNINLPSGESFSAQTPGAGALQVGYARVMSPTPRCWRNRGLHTLEFDYRPDRLRCRRTGLSSSD